MPDRTAAERIQARPRRPPLDLVPRLRGLHRREYPEGSGASWYQGNNTGRSQSRTYPQSRTRPRRLFTRYLRGSRGNLAPFLHSFDVEAFEPKTVGVVRPTNFRVVGDLIFEGW